MNNTHKTRLISWGTSIGIHTAFFLIVASTGIFAMVNRQPTEDLTAVIYDASGAAADDTAADSNQATDSVEPELAALEDISIPEAEVPPIEPKSTDTSTKELQKQNVEQNPATGKAENNNATGVNNSTGQSTGTSSGTASTGQADPNSPVPAVMPKLLNRVSPSYPENLRVNNVSGSVGVSFIVGTSGAVESVTITSSSGYEEFDTAAVNAVSQYGFQPAYNEAGRAVACRFSTVIHFTLQ